MHTIPRHAPHPNHFGAVVPVEPSIRGTDGERAKTLHRGPWAGGRFCITTLESLPKTMVGS